MSTGKNVRPISAPTKAWQLFARSGTAGTWWLRQTLGQLAALAAITLGLFWAATVADAQMGRSDGRSGAPALRNLSPTPAATDPAKPVIRRGTSGVIPT